jgi:uncharacterized protein (DUF305 family)
MQNNNRTILYAILILFLGLGIGYYYGVRQVKAPQAGMHMMPDGEVMKNGMMSGSADQRFIVEMIPHHQGAIDMAKVALEKSKRPEMLQLANEIIAAQTKEIQEMTAWYEAWYGTKPPEGGMGMHMAGMTGDLAALKAKSGDDFDREFLSQMIPHHEMAIMMAQMIRGSERAEMRQLSENIVTSQAREIQAMRTWLTSWFKN